MKKTIYMVKRNPELPNAQDNWLVLSNKEFKKYIKANNMEGRLFAPLGGEEYAEEIIIAECNKDQFKKWSSELERHKYLRKIETELDIVTFLASQCFSEEDSINYEDLFTTDFTSTEDEYMKKSVSQEVRNAISQLPAKQREVIELTYFYQDVLTREEIEKVQKSRSENALREAKIRGNKSNKPNDSEVLTESEVAEILSISQPSVHVRKANGIESLKKFLKNF